MTARDEAQKAPGLTFATPSGLAAVHLQRIEGARAALVLGHGAGGGIAAPDLAAVCATATAAGLTTALVEQPYRVAGRRSPPAAPALDAAWLSVLDQLGARELAGLRLIVGGRSSGARVACRTAARARAVAVVCLAFPLHPPGRAATVTRIEELEAVPVPTLVVQGERDPFGLPPAGPLRTVVRVPGDHSLRTGLAECAAAVAAWLPLALGEQA